MNTQATADPIEAAKTAGRRVITIPEAGSLLGLCRTESYRAAREGRIPTIETGARCRVVPIAALERLLQVTSAVE